MDQESALAQILNKLLEPVKPYYLPFLWKPKPKRVCQNVCKQFVNASDVVVEVGANFGGLTIMLSDLASHVYSFEPNPKTFRYLKRFVHGRRNVNLFKLAATDKIGEEPLDTDDTSVSEMSTIVGARPGIQLTKRLSVRTCTLDSISFHPDPTCIVLDCEGSEVAVLRGAQRLLNKYVRKVLSEIHTLPSGETTEQALRSLLSQNGFVVSKQEYWLVALKDP